MKLDFCTVPAAGWGHAEYKHAVCTRPAGHTDMPPSHEQLHLDEVQGYYWDNEQCIPFMVIA